MNQTGIIVMAAGNSSRLGKPKQLLFYHGRSLLQHVCSEAIKANLYPLAVVTGAYAKDVSATLAGENAVLVYNENWQQGMASGIAAGLSKILLLKNDIENIIICVCDQPYVSAQLFSEMIAKKEQVSKGIVACTYGDTMGTPVLFGKTYFEKLLELKGEHGAKRLFKHYPGDVVKIPFQGGEVDIDTEEDYLRLMKIV